MVEVKICGVCRPEDAAAAAEAGADYVGVILAPGGPRHREPARAAEILAAAGGARRVGVFVDAAPSELVATAELLALDVLQLHGSEPPGLVERVRGAGPWAVWKAIRPRDGAEFAAGAAAYAGSADALLVDGWSRRAAGGTGARFPWDEVAGALGSLPAGLSLVVAGGLTPETVAEAVARLAPRAVDVSSGVERRVGEKDPARIRAFVAAARAAAAASRSAASR